MVEEGCQQGETMSPNNKSIIDEFEPTFRFEMKVVEDEGLNVLHEYVSNHDG